MAIDLKFSKFDNTPWGFRLTGGSDYGLPLTVVKVNSGSLSESMGLREGDVMVALNDTKLGWITHEGAHDCITKAGNNFVVTVLRGNFDPDDVQKFALPMDNGPEPLLPFSQDIYPTPITNGFVNKVPSHSPHRDSPVLIRPIAKTYKPFSKDINNILPPLERPLILSPLHTDEFRTVKQNEWKEFSTKQQKQISPIITSPAPTPKNYIKDDVFINGGVLLDLNEIEKSAKSEDTKRGKIISIVKEYDETNIKENKQEETTTEETKSVKTIVENFNRASTPSPSLYKMTCRIRNPSVPTVQEEVVEKMEMIESKEIIISKSPKPKVEEVKRKSPVVYSKEVRELTKSDVSLEEAKVNAISAACVLSQEAKQRNYKLPCVAANIPTHDQSDVFLKTFFIHLTDVMVALTHMITHNECCHRAHQNALQCSTHNTNYAEQNYQTMSNMMQGFSQNLKNIHTSVDTNKVSKQNSETNKETVVKIVEKPPDEKIKTVSEGVQTEQVLKEVFQSTTSLGVDVTVNGKDPLEWLADLDSGNKLKRAEVKKLDVIVENNVQEETIATETKSSVTQIEQTSNEEKNMSEIVKEEVKTVESNIIETAVVENASAETTTVDVRKIAATEEISEEKKESSKEASMVVKETGENEYSVCLSRPKQEPSITQEIIKTSTEEVEINSSQAESLVQTSETMNLEISNLRIEKHSEALIESEIISTIEETTVQPTEEEKTKKRKKLMKVVAKDPQTPNTDEFFFKLDIKLDGNRSKTPITQINESDPSLHEDLSIVRRPDDPNYVKADQVPEVTKDPLGVMNDTKKSLKLDLSARERQSKAEEFYVLVCQQSPVDPFPPNTKHPSTVQSTSISTSIEKESSAVSKSESISIETALAKSEIENITVVAETAEAGKHCAVINQADTESSTLSVKSSEGVAIAETNASAASDTNIQSSLTHSAVSDCTKGTGDAQALGQIQQLSIMASEHARFTQQLDSAESRMTVLQEKNCQQATEEANQTETTRSKDVTNVASTETTRSAKQVTQETEESSVRTEERISKEQIAEIKQTMEHSMQKAETHKQQTKAAEETKYDVNLQTSSLTNGFSNGELQVEMAVSCQMNGFSNGHVSQDPVQLLDEQIATATTRGIKQMNFATVESSRVVTNGHGVSQNGCNGTDVNEDEDVGKPGLTDDEIADILTGEAEILKDQHVIGLQKVLASHMSRPAENDDSSINFNKMMPVCGFLKESEVFKALNEDFIKSRAEMLEEQRKHSKFLVKPNRPVPFCKRLAQAESKEPPYRVNIKKQPKKDSTDLGPSILTEGVFLVPEVPILVPEPPPELYVAPEYLADSELPDLEETGIPVPQPTPQNRESPEKETSKEDQEEGDHTQEETSLEEETDQVNEEEEAGDMKGDEKEWKELIVDEKIDESLPVEQQLVKVQKQLEALSRLPAAIQQTLDLVSKQLGKMVPRNDTPNAEIAHQENDISEEPHQNGVCEIQENGHTETEEQCNGSMQNGNEENHVENGHQIENECDEVQGSEERVQESRVVPEQQAECVTEEVKIQQIKQNVIDELTNEHNMRQLKQRPTPQTGGPKAHKGPKPAFGPLTPVTRPVVLPGGRKWRGPKDAFTDAFIAETLSSQASVIQGTTLGVNFMKYNKPPVTLDHLKESSVYKLVHELDEEPLHGVEARPSKVVAESEYRERCQSTTPMCQ